MKNLRITFRLSPYQLARGLQTIRQLEPTYKLISLNNIVKTIYHDYLSKMTLNKLDDIPPSIIAEINQLNNKPKQEQITVADLIKLKTPKPEPTNQPDFSDQILAEINKISNQTKASKFDDPNNTESSLSSITDFSPPEDWNL